MATKKKAAPKQKVNYIGVWLDKTHSYIEEITYVSKLIEFEGWCHYNETSGDEEQRGPDLVFEIKMNPIPEVNEVVKPVTVDYTVEV